jgi:sec-independent protein translocase protein TatB
MFDISWTEFLLIGIVALIVIGPKELPGVLRTMGQWTRKLRGMASEFQHQFQEAMREAEMADLKKQVDDITHDIKNYDPLKGVRDDVESISKDIESPVTAPPTPSVPTSPAEPSLPEATAQMADSNVAGTATGPVAPEAAEQSAGELLATAAAPGGEGTVVAAATAPVAPEPAAEIPQPGSTRRAG